MRRFAFVVAFLGIFVLLGLLVFLPPKEIKSLGDLQDLRVNQKVFLTGKVESEKQFGDFNIMHVEGVEVVCECKRSYIDKDLEILGAVSEYEGKKQVSVLRIKILN